MVMGNKLIYLLVIMAVFQTAQGGKILKKLTKELKKVIGGATFEDVFVNNIDHINSIATDVNSIATDVSNNEAGIHHLADNITDLADHVYNATNDVANIKVDVANNDAAISSVVTGVSNNAAAISSNDAEILSMISHVNRVRLQSVNVSDQANEGYVEILGSGGMWGGICDDSWDKLDADVICRMLGYPEAEEAYHGSQHSYRNTSGPGSGNNFILDDVQCTGTEYDIFDCPRISVGAGGEGVHDCGANEWAAVKCLLKGDGANYDAAISSIVTDVSNNAAEIATNAANIASNAEDLQLTGIFENCVNEWCLQIGTNQQYTKCESTADNGQTCIKPGIRYGNVYGPGRPQVNSGNDYDLWCQQLGGSNYVTHSEGTTAGYPSEFCVFGCTSYDEANWHWCDCHDGYWYDGSIDSTFANYNSVVSITCGARNMDAVISSISNNAAAISNNTHQIQQLGDVCPTSSFNSNYRSFNSTCYYFESYRATYYNAQTACNSKFGTTGGKLAEPIASVELYAFLYSEATSIINYGPYWIGIDDLLNNDGVFRYASTSSVASVPSGFSGSLDNSPADQDCAQLGSATDVEDQYCSRTYGYICEINTLISIKAEVASNSINIASNNVDISDNAAAISSNAAGVSNNAAGVSNNAADISSNDAEIISISNNLQILQEAAKCTSVNWSMGCCTSAKPCSIGQGDCTTGDDTTCSGDLTCGSNNCLSQFGFGSSSADCCILDIIDDIEINIANIQAQLDSHSINIANNDADISSNDAEISNISTDLARATKCTAVDWSYGATAWDCCTTANPCSFGEGDCNSSNDNTCGGGLVCGTDNCASDFGFGDSAADCCIWSSWFRDSEVLNGEVHGANSTMVNETDEKINKD